MLGYSLLFCRAHDELIHVPFAERDFDRQIFVNRAAIIGRIELDYTNDELAVALNKPTANAARMAVERAHPNLIGGIGIYKPTGAHSGFVHLDTRGYRARW